MLEILLPIISTLGICWFLIPYIIKIADQKHLFDLPEGRKQHKHAVPALGGIAIYASILLSQLLFSPEMWGTTFKMVLAAFFVLVLVGVRDDLIGMRPLKKLCFQFLAANLIFLSGLRIDQLFELSLHYQFSTPVSYILTVFFVCVLINAYNFIDGVDGLASSLGLVASLIYGSLFAINGNMQWAILAFSFGAGLLGFLRFNLFKAKIFLGDNGSMLIGAAVACFGLKFINLVPDGSSVTVGIALALLPVFDLFRVFATRILKGRSPFYGDRTHIHHLLMALGMKAPQISISLSIVCLVLFGVSQIMNGLPNSRIVLVLTLLAICFNVLIVVIIRYRFSRKQRTQLAYPS